MTYLELCQAVVDEIGLSGQIQSVISQRGDFSRIVRFVRAATQQIEGRWINWRFLRRSYTFTTSVGISTYSPPPTVNVRQWDQERFYVDDLNIQGCFADAYIRDPISENYDGYPSMIIVEANNDLRLIGRPDRAYTIVADYFRTPTLLTNNTDTPRIPEQFQRAIVADAMRRYANYDEAAELYQQAIEELYGVSGTWLAPEPGSLIAVLQADQLPNTFSNGANQGGQFVVTTEQLVWRRNTMLTILQAVQM